MPAHWLQLESCRAGFKSGGKDQLWSLNKPSGCAFGLANDSTKPWGHGKSKKARFSRLYSYNINLFIPTQNTEEEQSDRMQSLGWQPTLCVAWCLIWWFCKFRKKIWSYMTLNVLYWDQVSLNNTNPTQPMMTILSIPVHTGRLFIILTDYDDLAHSFTQSGSLTLKTWLIDWLIGWFENLIVSISNEWLPGCPGWLQLGEGSHKNKLTSLTVITHQGNKTGGKLTRMTKNVP